jgi:hypothetical protein
VKGITHCHFFTEVKKKKERKKRKETGNYTSNFPYAFMAGIGMTLLTVLRCNRFNCNTTSQAEQYVKGDLHSGGFKKFFWAEGGGWGTIVFNNKKE